MAKFKAQMLWDNIEKGDLSAVHGLLESGNINLEERDENGQTYLMLASEKGELHIVRELLDAGVDPNAVDNDNWSALLCAAKEGHLEIVIVLLEKKASIEHRDMCGWTALMWASYKGHSMVVQELLDRGSNANVKAEHNMTCLAWASGRGHTEVVKKLLECGAKVNATDKYGTTPLIWASRKGYLEITECLLADGANVDSSGMNSWTPLLVATQGGFLDVVRAILEHDPNVNAVDKDALTALAIGAKEGFVDIVHDLMTKGAYVNVADRAGDTVLIHAVKGGHTEVVRILLQKYADVDVEGSEEKTALYWAVEKGHTDIVNQLLESQPDLEISTKDGDTPLLRAVRSRNEEIVKLLLNKGSKVSATDKRGDTALHIAIRARSKRITELLLRNPRNGRLLYRANKSGETPYNMDTYHQRGILTQILGQRNLNATDAENLLGYEIYSSALADILSEPGLVTPITVGLYAKWGSGKSFLLGKLKGEMKSFTMQNVQGPFTFSWVLFITLFLINAIIGEVLGLAVRYEVGLGVGLGLFPLEYGFLGILNVCAQRYDMNLAVSLSQVLGEKQHLITLLIKMLFCNQKRRSSSDKLAASIFSVRFLFSECTRLTSVGGEKSLAAMIATLCEAVENEYGILVARLFRVFKPRTDHSKGRFKSMCCIPNFIFVIIFLLVVAVGIAMIVVYKISNNTAVNAVLIAIVSIIGLTLISNIYTIAQATMALLVSQKKRVLRAADNLDVLKMDGFMQQLKLEVDMMSRMVNCMDIFTQKQTRLVVIVDGLDSCEQDKVLQVLDIVKALFSDDNAPFITILAVDPHIIIKGIEQNLRSTFLDSNVNGFDYLRNVVHLPFYLQSQGVRVQRQESVGPSNSSQENQAESPGKPYKHQESILSTSSESSKYSRKRSKSAKFGSLTGSQGGVNTSSFDLSSQVVKNDYFSDINPRSMRRLMNIVAVTARLLRAYNIDFNWHRLMAWINIIEQWPYRVSWIIYYFEESDCLDRSQSLHSIYQKIAPRVPASKDVDPLVEIDRNVRKMEAFLASKSGNTPLLNVGDLRKFLPCTINLDPYLRKLIREMQHNADMQRTEFGLGPVYPTGPSAPLLGMRDSDATLPTRGSFVGLQQRVPSAASFTGMMPGHMMQYGPMGMQGMMPMQYMAHPSQMSQGMMAPPPVQGQRTQPQVFFHDLPKDVCLSQLSVDSVCNLLHKLEGVNQQMLPIYIDSIRDNNISGLVLANCDMDELGKVMRMKFGDWQLFKVAILSLIDSEATLASSNTSNDVRGTDSSSFINKHTSRIESAPSLEEPSKKFAASSRSRDSCTSLPDRNAPTDAESMRRGRFKRTDSIVQQLSYETAILREALEEFTEETSDADEMDQRNDEDDGPIVYNRSMSEESAGYSIDNSRRDTSQTFTATIETPSSADKSVEGAMGSEKLYPVIDDTDDGHKSRHEHGHTNTLSSSLEKLAKPFIQVLEHPMGYSPASDKTPLLAIPSDNVIEGATAWSASVEGGPPDESNFLQGHGSKHKSKSTDSDYEESTLSEPHVATFCIESEDSSDNTMGSPTAASRSLEPRKQSFEDSVIQYFRTSPPASEQVRMKKSIESLPSEVAVEMSPGARMVTSVSHPDRIKPDEDKESFV
ncbi:kinase D-interacting substrate of 220 kDa B-like isoform X1 [Haliotis rufescens]|uniref:kinase D-interacting substrate of 220 kDa B-like isoform X1 n=2 Tax=Haliotis rufescens TaxID=6454 RepID=UPI00201EE0F2|nr:kinase D-interacting substrate of 220 kDa B-like isoform X1 [Haliotis rufescens]XP_046352601.2 kinase D-interacting substrate of 220 kDa B-like isoform X1 [Haliotis rufescens]XP_048243238.1 kinase D-interacting substrate of 220 kDa B-like isoform X1 [Haliotis rufescens]